MTSSLSESAFRIEVDRALERLQRSLMPLADEEGFEVELQNGVLQVVFEVPAATKFVISPNAPVRQIWVSAMARSYKLTWSAATSAFELNGEPLDALTRRLIGEFLAS